MNSKAIILGRRNCTRCTQWRHIIDFPPRRNRHGVVTSVHGECHACRRKRNREVSAAQRRRNRVSAKIHERKKRRIAGSPVGNARTAKKGRVGTVPIGPFARWLSEMVEKHGSELVHVRTGLNQRRIYSYIRGYDPTGNKHYRHKNKRKAAVVDFIDFEVVDRALLQWGDPELLNKMYPTDRYQPAPLSQGALRYQQR